jgi:hypothetical protein
MAKSQGALSGSLSEGFLPALQELIFQPWTNLQGMFQNWFSPSISFGGNIQDRGVEKHVLEKVGSYGKQLNCVLDALEVLVSRQERKELTPDEQYALLRFENLARQADEAAAKFQGKPRRERAALRMADIDDWVAALLKLKQTNVDAYVRLVAHLNESLPKAPTKV